VRDWSSLVQFYLIPNPFEVNHDGKKCQNNNCGQDNYNPNENLQ